MVQTEVIAGGYLKVAGVLRGMGGRVIVHGGAQDICITDSSQWPVMSVTSWRDSPDVVDDSGKGVMSVLASSVVEVDIMLSSEVVDFTEELASVEPSESPLIVLTTVVTTFVLV